MKLRHYFAASLVVLATACASTGAVFGPTPEAQIKLGADTVAAGSRVGEVALRNNKITVDQAKSYRAILGTAAGHLKVADARLLDCRAKTKSTRETRPDPCAATVADDIDLGVSIAKDVYNTLQGK